MTATDGPVTAPTSKRTSDVTIVCAILGSSKLVVARLGLRKEDFKFVGAIHGSSGRFLRILESMGKSRIMAAPRLLVLNKQVAEVQLGGFVGYQEAEVSRAMGIVSAIFKEVPIDTQFRVQPFVAADGTIRLDATVTCSTGQLNADGIPM